MSVIILTVVRVNSPITRQRSSDYRKKLYATYKRHIYFSFLTDLWRHNRHAIYCIYLEWIIYKFDTNYTHETVTAITKLPPATS